MKLFRSCPHSVRATFASPALVTWLAGCSWRPRGPAARCGFSQLTRTGIRTDLPPSRVDPAGPPPLRLGVPGGPSGKPEEPEATAPELGVLDAGRPPRGAGPGLFDTHWHLRRFSRSTVTEHCGPATVGDCDLPVGRQPQAESHNCHWHMQPHTVPSRQSGRRTVCCQCGRRLSGSHPASTLDT